jgi:DNA repair exonuclease SbcCD ATPase subunit
MNRPLAIGDRVRVVGPDGGDSNEFLGTEFEITEAWKNGGVMKFSAIGVPFFPESSLELVEEEKPKLSFSYCPDTTDIERAIGAAKEQLYRLSFIETSEEVNDRLAAIEKRQDEQREANDKIRHRLHELERDQLELKKASHYNFLSGPELELDQLMVRIQALEKWQVEHDLAAQKPQTIHMSAYIDPEAIRKQVLYEIARRLNR